MDSDRDLTRVRMFRQLKKEIRGSKESLRLHLGATENPIEKKRCAELLCASLFGFQYVRLLQKKLRSTE